MRGCDCALDDEDEDGGWEDNEPASPELLAAMRAIDKRFTG